jgi:hypothetical protein
MCISCPEHNNGDHLGLRNFGSMDEYSISRGNDYHLVVHIRTHPPPGLCPFCAIRVQIFGETSLVIRQHEVWTTVALPPLGMFV